jgi:uncharacterized membrane protein YdjX (TVP38/TMEM64 family)
MGFLMRHSIIKKVRDAIPLIVMLTFAMTCWIVLKATGVVANLDIPALSNWVRSLGFLGVLVYMLSYTVRPLIFFPAAPLTLFGGYTFGAFNGTLYDVIGAGTGALLAFWIARKFGRGSVEKLLSGKKLQSFDERVGDNGFLVILYMRLFPFPFDGVNYGAGLSKIRARDYIPATYLGIIPGAFVYNYVGQSLHDIGSGQFYTAIGLYLVLALTPLVYKGLKKQRA